MKQFAFFAYQRKPLDSLRLGDKLYNYNDCPYALRVASSYINYQQENESYSDNINNNNRILSDENIELFDLMGKRIFTNEVLTRDKLLLVKSGIYLIKIKEENNHFSFKKLFIE